MSQTEEFVKVVEAAKEAKGVIFVTGKPGSGKRRTECQSAGNDGRSACQL